MEEKQEGIKQPAEPTKEEKPKEPQIFSEARGEYIIVDKEQKIYRFSFPIKNTLHENHKALMDLQASVWKAISEKIQADAAEAKKKIAETEEEKKEEGPETKTS